MIVPAMSQRHFEFLAHLVNSAPTFTEGQKIERVRWATRLADALASTNERFNRARFLRACGVEG